MNQLAVKWMTLENGDATRTLKQHGYVPAIRKMRYTLEPYEGNKMLCSRGFCSEDGDTADHFSTLEGEERTENCCQRCLKIYNRLVAELSKKEETQNKEA